MIRVERINYEAWWYGRSLRETTKDECKRSAEHTYPWQSIQSLQMSKIDETIVYTAVVGSSLTLEWIVRQSFAECQRTTEIGLLMSHCGCMYGWSFLLVKGVVRVREKTAA